MALEVQVQLHPARVMEIGMPNGETLREEGLPFYRISIPVPGRGEPVHVIGFRADDMSMDDQGNYRDPRVQSHREEGYFAHVITDASGNRVTVLMTEEDWASYQTALSQFAAAAASSPTLYHPTQASTAFGLFAPQAQAGSSPVAPTIFRPLSDDQMTRAGVGVGGMSSYYRGEDIDIAVYEPRTDPARATLRNAGYVEVRYRTLDDRNNYITVSRFMSPVDAAIYREMGSP